MPAKTPPVKRVVHVGPDPGAAGGVASVLRTYTRSALAARYAIEVVPTTAGGSPLSRAAQGARGVVRACLRALSPDRPLFHVHMASRGSFWRKGVVVLWARAWGCPVVLHLHGAEFHKFAAGGTAARRRTIAWVFRAASRVVVLSPEWADRVAGFSGRADSVVVPNPVEVPPDTAPDARGAAPGVVFLGRVGPRKGIPELLEAIRTLQGEGSAARYTIAGDGDVAAARKTAATLPDPSAVELPGWLGETAVRKALAGAAVFCLPSHDEGKPVALLEAMAYGLACVATPVGGVPDLVTDGVTGLLVPPGDATALAGALRRVLSDRPLRRSLGAAAAEHVREVYAADRVAARLVDLYTSLGYPPGRKGTSP